MTLMAVLHLRPISGAGTVSLDHFLYLGGGLISNSKLNRLREALFPIASLPAARGEAVDHITNIDKLMPQTTVTPKDMVYLFNTLRTNVHKQ